MATEYDRYVRQIVFPGIGEAGQRKLQDARVVLVGCGADGSLIADRMVRAGVGHLTLIDRDFIELNNLQRQFLYDEDDWRASLPKAIAAERKLRRINSQVQVAGMVTDLNVENVEEMLTNADLVMDGTDNPETRYLINDACVKHGISWVHCGVAASYGVVMTIVPHQTPCLRCVIPEPPRPGTFDTCDTAGIINPIIPAIAGIAVAEGLKLLIGSGTRLEGLFRLDLWENTIETYEGSSPRPDCPTCGLGRYEFLEGASGTQTVSLYGRDAVQIRVPGDERLPLADIAERLRAVSEIIASNDYLIRFKVDGHEITLFADARATVKGTSDQTIARSLYSKYVGV